MLVKDSSRDPERCTACLNCETPLTGSFCGKCGQRARGRLTSRELVGDLLAHVLTLESALGRTVIGLARRPGAVCLDYVKGRRARYISPLRYCLLTLALYLLVGLVLGADPTKAVGNISISSATTEVANAARAKIGRHIGLDLVGCP